ncbi:MYXO-CTERM sorting domain-containing protein [Pyxidicoccus sp. 3LFB2]
MKHVRPARFLLAAFALLAAPAGLATSPPPSIIFHPAEGGQRLLPSNASFIASSTARRLPAAAVSLFDAMGAPLPVTVETGIDAIGAVRAKPQAQLPPGRYRLEVDGESLSFDLGEEADTEAPSAITGVRVGEAQRLEFSHPTDNVTAAPWLGYAVYTAPAPALPDTEGAPAIAAYWRPDGGPLVGLLRGDNCYAVFAKGATGRYNVSLRARDEAGNLGPPSAPVELDVARLPECAAEDTDEGGCSAAPAPVLLPAVVLPWLAWRRRRAARSTSR